MNDQNPTEKNPTGSQIQVQIDDQTAMGRYSNFMLVNHNENEFVIDFAYVLPGPPRARVLSRVIVSPKHMKRVVATLQQNQDAYFERLMELESTEQQLVTAVRNYEKYIAEHVLWVRSSDPLSWTDFRQGDAWVWLVNQAVARPPAAAPYSVCCPLPPAVSAARATIFNLMTNVRYVSGAARFKLFFRIRTAH